MGNVCTRMMELGPTITLVTLLENCLGQNFDSESFSFVLIVLVLIITFVLIILVFYIQYVMGTMLEYYLLFRFG